ncbi:hypothetical protein OROMI_020617 [Orobanche minor]
MVNHGCKDLLECVTQILLQKDLGIFGSLDNMDHSLENEGKPSWRWPI